MDKFVPGFAINRLQRILGREIFFLLDNGYITADQLDLAVKASIAPRMMLLGLVQRYDFTGLDLSAKNLENQEFTEAPADNRPRSLFRLVEKGRPGCQVRKRFLRLHRQALYRDAEGKGPLAFENSEEHGFLSPANHRKVRGG